MSESDLIPMTTCPYNKAHRLKVSRLPYHIMKCEKQYAYLGYKICFYNHSHRMPADQYLDHTKNCPDRFNFNSKPQPFVYGHSDTTDVPYVSGEWDNEPEESLAPCPIVPQGEGKVAQQQSHVYDGFVYLREHYTGAILPPSLADIGNLEEKHTKSFDDTNIKGSEANKSGLLENVEENIPQFSQASSSTFDKKSEQRNTRLPEAIMPCHVKSGQSQLLGAIESASSVKSENPQDLVKLLNMTCLIDSEVPSENGEI